MKPIVCIAFPQLCQCLTIPMTLRKLWQPTPKSAAGYPLGRTAIAYLDK
jgi:hypothetical protein